MQPFTRETASEPRYVAYYRVSTREQGASGLGLEAQRASVLAYVRNDHGITAEFTEVESGKRNDRPQLASAIAEAKRTGARLVIAKLDRLSRNAAFIFALRDSGVDFVCADMPDANTLTIGIFATLAQHERELISQRTRAALVAKKAQGHRLGTPANLTATARQQSLNVRSAAARTARENRQAAELAAMYRERGLSYRQIAEKLNASGYSTRRGCSFQGATVRRVLAYLDSP